MAANRRDEKQNPAANQSLPTKTNFIVTGMVSTFCVLVFGLSGYCFEKPSSTAASSTNWKTYQNADVTFKFPSRWVERPMRLRGSEFTQGFEDPEEKISFTFSSIGNYSQMTGKSYSSLDDFLNLHMRVRTIAVDGQEGRQPLPRAGCENTSLAIFFSNDSKYIYTLALQAGTTALATPETDVEQQKLFDQILSTFKFIQAHRQGQLPRSQIK